MHFLGQVGTDLANWGWPSDLLRKFDERPDVNFKTVRDAVEWFHPIGKSSKTQLNGLGVVGGVSRAQAVRWYLLNEQMNREHIEAGIRVWCKRHNVEVPPDTQPQTGRRVGIRKATAEAARERWDGGEQAHDTESPYFGRCDMYWLSGMSFSDFWKKMVVQRRLLPDDKGYFQVVDVHQMIREEGGSIEVVEERQYVDQYSDDWYTVRHWKAVWAKDG